MEVATKPKARAQDQYGRFVPKDSPLARPLGAPKADILDVKRSLTGNPATMRALWAKLLELAYAGDGDALRLALAYCWGAPPTAQLVEHKGDVTIRVVRDEAAPPVVAEARVVDATPTP